MLRWLVFFNNNVCFYVFLVMEVIILVVVAIRWYDDINVNVCFFVFVVVGVVIVDFFFGLVYWGVDIWGVVDIFIFGKVFIRFFREYYVDFIVIIRYDLIEINGDNCLLILFGLFYMVYKFFIYD